MQVLFSNGNGLWYSYVTTSSAAARKTGKCVSSVTATNQLKDEEKWKAREIQKAEDDILKEPNSKKIKLETS